MALRSPPHEGAWIEISEGEGIRPHRPRRPLMRGRGLKFGKLAAGLGLLESPPHEGAWIEIISLEHCLSGA